MADSEEVIDEYDLTDSSGEDNALNLVPLATFGNGKTSTPGILSSVVADSSAPWAEDGVLHIPAGMIINDVQAGDSWSISNGTITVARANGTTEGVIGSISIESTTSKVPVISQGSIIIPLAQAAEGELSTSIHTPGAISGIEYHEGTCLSIVDGVIKIPKPQTNFPAGLYNAASGEKIPWATFLAGTSPVPMSQPKDGLRIMAFHLGEYLSFYLEAV